MTTAVSGLVLTNADADDAVAAPPPDRIVIRGSRVVARTSTAREFPH